MFHNCLKPLSVSLAIKRLCCGVQFHAFRHTKVHFNGKTMRHTTISKVFFFFFHIHLQYPPPTHPPPPCFSGHYPCDGQTDREGSGFLCVFLWLLFCLHTSVCFRITGHSIRSRISESCNNNPDYGKQTCCLFSNPSHRLLTSSTMNILESFCIYIEAIHSRRYLVTRCVQAL